MTLALGAALRRLRRPRMDAGGVLRGGRGRHRHHRALGLEAHARCRSGRSAAVGDRRRHGPRHGVDGDGDRQLVHPVWRGGAARAGAAAPRCSPGSARARPARAGLAPPPDDRPDRHRDAGRAGPDPLVLHEGGRLRVRQRARHRALPLRRRRAGVPVAHRPAVPRRGRGGHADAGAGGDHGGLHRLSRRAAWRAARGRASASSCPPISSS